MKYYTEELLRGINSADESVREKANRELSQNLRNYALYYETIKNCFSKKFISIFEKNDEFHDSFIDEIKYVAKKRTIIINTSYTNVSFKLSFENVSKVSFNMCLEDMFWSTLCWQYCEFELQSDKKMKFNLLCEVGNELEFVYEKLRIEMVDKSGNLGKNRCALLDKIFNR